LLDNSLCISSIQRGKDWSLSHSCIPSLPYGHFFKVQTQPCVKILGLFYNESKKDWKKSTNFL
jgi:hypothetical protein